MYIYVYINLCACVYICYENKLWHHIVISYIPWLIIEYAHMHFIVYYSFNYVCVSFVYTPVTTKYI